MSNYDWIKQIPASLLQWDDIPLTGDYPSFPWEGLSKKLSQLFGLEDLAIKLLDTKWLTEKQYLDGIPNAVPLYIAADGIEGNMTWLIPKDDLAAVMSLILLKTPNTKAANNDSEFLRGFYLFLALETLHSIKELQFAPSLPMHLVEEAPTPREAALSFDIEASAFEQKVIGRLLVSSEFRAGWARRHTPKTPDIYFQAPLAEKLDLTVNLEAGHTTLTQQQWGAVSVGDFVILDRCSIDPEQKNGGVLLKINDIPLFTAELKEGAVTILEPTQVHEG